MGPESEGSVLLRALSRLLGWTYVLSWSLSFYPQPLLNWRRRSTLGVAIDFPFMNVLGFISYTSSTAAFYYSRTIREQYAARNPRSPEPTVRFNDFAFAAHALLLCLITYSQFFPNLWGFKVGAHQRTSRVVLGVFWGAVVGVLVILVLVWGSKTTPEADRPGWDWIDVVYAVGYIKIVTTLVKYCPQVMVNYRRKSTVGWSIGQILLDFTGGILSILQLGIDASLQGATLSGISGNPAKFLLGNVSIVFDVIFCVQHYILYRDARLEARFLADDVEPLLNDNN